MKLLDGKKTAAWIMRELAAEVKRLKRSGVTPGLAFFVTPDTVGETYVRIKEKVAKDLGVRTLHGSLKTPTTAGVIKIINGWNKNKKVHGIVVQLPLPKKVDTNAVLNAITLSKDIDGLKAGSPYFGATPLGVVELLKRHKIKIAGSHAVVVGRSRLVGRPLSLLLLDNDATVTVCHSKTKKLGAITKTADILVSAAGHPGLIKSSMVKKEAVVVDVGITRVRGKLVGDVDFTGVSRVASYITPVPGGVGPMTVIMLLKNLIHSAQRK